MKISDRVSADWMPGSLHFLGSYGKVSLVRHNITGEEMVWKQTNYSGMNDKEK